MHRIHVIDSHTGGEPTRVVVEGGPDLVGSSLREMADDFRNNHDEFRSAVVNEPRGSDVLVGALLCNSPDPSCETGVIFFNNVGLLGMCGHGMIGVVATMAHLGRLSTGVYKVDTPVGTVTVQLHADQQVSVTNVASYRKAKNVTVDVPGMGPICGDVAWAGNWFFLVGQHKYRLELSEIDTLTDAAWRMRMAINGGGYPEVDHVELFGPPVDSANDSRNFVLCPGKAYDRSPCGTGTSAKVACLAADGKLLPGIRWRQESIIGSVFEATYELLADTDKIYPTIKGRAWICGDTKLIFDPTDPFRNGIRLPAG